MTTAELIFDLEERGVEFKLKGKIITLVDHQGILTGPIEEDLKSRKAEVLELLKLPRFPAFDDYWVCCYCQEECWQYARGLVKGRGEDLVPLCEKHIYGAWSVEAQTVDV